MKTIILLILFLVIEVRCEENNKFCFEATFSEGFGVYIKRSLVIKKNYAKKGTKREGDTSLIIEIEKDNKLSTLSLDCSLEVREALNKALGNGDNVKITGIGYETIKSSGSPSIGKSASDEDIMVPPSIGWHVKKVFILESFEIDQKGTDKPSPDPKTPLK
jgi:hypothetical protein